MASTDTTEGTVGQVDTHIDWLSFTLDTKLEPRTASALYTDAKYRLKEHCNGLEKIFFDGQGFDPTTSRAPYRVAISRNDHGAAVFGSSHTNTTLYELTGRGCEPLREGGYDRAVLDAVAERVTRLDVAVDIPTDTRPTDFANSRHHNRFKSISYIRSRSGETVYVGSPKSDRFCRVYRYSDPHPRAHLLRVEFVFRKSLARAAARSYCEAEAQADFVAQLGNTYGYSHDDWQPQSDTNQRLTVPITTRQDAETVSWLYSQVAPAMRRLIGTGALDVADFLEHVYDGTT